MINKRAIKKIRTEIANKIKWNKILKDKIKKNKWQKTVIKRMETKFNTKIKWNKMLMDEIEKYFLQKASKSK